LVVNTTVAFPVAFVVDVGDEKVPLLVLVHVMIFPFNETGFFNASTACAVILTVSPLTGPYFVAVTS